MVSKIQTIAVFLALVCGCLLGAQNKKGFSLDANSGLPVFFPLAKKDFVKLSSAYGYRYHPIRHKVKKHRGLDLVAKMGKPVYASAKGKVITNDRHAGYGNRIVLQHANGIKTLYGHLMKSKVRKGQTVKKGEIIGLVGQTGQTTGPHLHYEIWIKSKKIDPISFWSKVISEQNKEAVVVK